MRYIVFVLGSMVAGALGLLGLIHSKRSMEIQLTKTSYFESVKHRVTSDVLKEFQANIAEANRRLEQTNTDVEKLLPDVKSSQEATDGKTAEMNTCNDELNKMKTESDAVEAEKKKTETEFEQNIGSLKEQINNFKAEFENRSIVCDYVIKTSVEGMKLCGMEPVTTTEKKTIAPQKA